VNTFDVFIRDQRSKGNHCYYCIIDGYGYLKDALIIGLCAWFGFGVVDGLLVGSRQGVIYGVIVGVFSGLFFGIDDRIGSNLVRDLDSTIRPAEMVTWSWENVWRNLGKSLRRGLTIGLSILVCVSVTLGCASTLFHGPEYGLRYGLALGPIIGLIAEVASTLSILLNSGWSSDILDERQLSKPNEGVHRSARNSLLAALIIGPIGRFASGLISGMAFALVGVTGWFTLGVGFAIVFALVFAFVFWNVYAHGLRNEIPIWLKRLRTKFRQCAGFCLGTTPKKLEAREQCG
jgi:hypothetical protein